MTTRTSFPTLFIGLTAFVIGALWAAAPAARADGPAEHTAVGQTAHVTLDKGETKDFALPLGKGDYVIILDVKRSDDKQGNIQSTVQLLKTNGVIVNPDLISSNSIAITDRVTARFHVMKPFAARLRLSHEQNVPIEHWVTILPGKTSAFLPFGFGGDIQAVTIGDEAGVGGTLEKEGDAFYYKALLPPGKWSISLGLTLKDKGNLQGEVDLLDARGATQKERFVNVNEIGTQARQEALVTVTKPRTLLLRVKADSNAGFGGRPENYNLSITKSTD